MTTTPAHALSDIDPALAIDPAPRLAGAPVFGGPGNQDFDLTPARSEGRETLQFDFPGVQIGSAHYAEGPTGASAWQQASTAAAKAISSCSRTAFCKVA